VNGSWQIVPDENEDADPRKLRSVDLRRVAVLAAAIAIVAASVGPFSFTAATQTCNGVSSPTGSMNVARSGHTATLLRSGKVLVAGGFGPLHNPSVSDYDQTATASAELYDPTTGIWSPTGSLKSARAFHAAALLPSGKVLVAGGSQGTTMEDEPLSSAELYDPVTGQWTQTGAMAIGGDVFAAIVLRSGNVFVLAGRMNPNGFRGTEAQLYDPASARWHAVGGLFVPFGSATLLGSGNVLVLAAGRHAFLYEPVSGAWKPAGDMSAIREWHTATLLRSGKVLVTGGVVPSVGPISSAEVYDPVTNSWSLTSSMTIQSWSADATLLPSGEVLVAGGESHSPGAGIGTLASIVLYDQATSTWTAPGAMGMARSFFTATLLRSGVVLYAGGSHTDQYVYASAEIYALTCHLD
jgi:hypothetical protein